MYIKLTAIFLTLFRRNVLFDQGHLLLIGTLDYQYKYTFQLHLISPIEQKERGNFLGLLM